MPFSPLRDSDTAVPNADLAAASEKPHAIAVPLQRIGSLLVVAIMVNSTRQARLIIDTGASHTVLSRSIASDAQLFTARRPVQVTMQTVGGQVQGDMVRVDSIRVADLEVKDSWAAIYDLPDAPTGVEGLLGLNFLRQFEMTLDSARNQLYLEKIHP
jgi:clan AA aspartic protease (TIGR02281 family)